MSTEAAGRVNVVLSVNQVNFTAAMKEAQANLDKFAVKAKGAGHAGVTNVQAVSASLRSLNGGFENNLRSMERWVAQSKTATAVAKTMFPIVGAATFGFMIGTIGMKVVDFIEKANKMPKAIEMGFGSLLLSSQSSIDALRLTNDQLENAIAKLEGKRQNNLAIQFDEAAKAADKLAASIESGSNKLDELLSKNHLSGWAILTGKQGTADREGTLKYFGDQQDSNAYDLADATSRGDKGGIARAQAALKATQDAELANLRGDLSNRETNSKNPGALNDTANMSIDKGAIAEILKQQQEQAEEVRNAKDTSTKADLDASKAASEQAKKAAHDRVEAMQTALDAMKLQYSMSIKATYDYWELKKSTELAGGTAYNDIVKKQSELAVQAATEVHGKIVKAIAEIKRNGAEDSTTGPALINSSARFYQERAAKNSADQDADARDSNQLDMNRASTTAHLQEARITDAAGDSMTRYAAAVALANVHAKELKDTLFDLRANIDIAQRVYDTATDPDAKRQAGHVLTQAKDAYSNAQTSGAIQVIQDNTATDPGFTSATTGATDALNEFVKASRDSAAMMRDLVNNTLSGLNNQIVTALTGGKTNFRQFGLGVTKNVAGAALQKGEGAVSGLLGFGPGGKLGTKGNPIYTVSTGSGASASALTSLIPSGKSSGVAGFFGGLMKTVLPFLATGGPIDGPAIVGEQGPELFMPSGAGTIVPNHQLATSSSSNGSVSYSIDARGTDPVQTEQRVRSAIVAAHQSSVNQAVKQVHQQSSRQPSRSR